MYGDALTVGSEYLTLSHPSFHKLALGLSSKKPMTIDLIELSPSDAAAFATREFLSVSLGCMKSHERCTYDATDHADCAGGSIT
jgi:hypothetical protein